MIRPWVPSAPARSPGSAGDELIAQAGGHGGPGELAVQPFGVGVRVGARRDLRYGVQASVPRGRHAVEVPESCSAHMSARHSCRRRPRRRARAASAAACGSPAVSSRFASSRRCPRLALMVSTRLTPSTSSNSRLAVGPDHRQRRVQVCRGGAGPAPDGQLAERRPVEADVRMQDVDAAAQVDDVLLAIGSLPEPTAGPRDQLANGVGRPRMIAVGSEQGAQL